jgi:hypothetical protein
MSDDLDALAKVAASDSEAALSARIDRERRLQTRSRRIRLTCRLVVILCGLGGVAGIVSDNRLLFGLGCFLFVPTLIAAVILFFMGGLVPAHVRALVSDNERRSIDQYARRSARLAGAFVHVPHAWRMHSNRQP